MNASPLILAAMLVPVLSFAQTPSAVESPTSASWVNEARDISTSIPPKLLAVLTAAIEKSDAANAIAVCKDEAPKMAQAASKQTGWHIRRVSLGQRNPMATPDAWERETLLAFDRNQAAGADVGKLEHAEVVTENGQQVRRYMRALPTMPMCVQCHGPVESLQTNVREKLKQLYPDDRGTGYSVGQIRGAITLRQPIQ